MLKSFAKTHIGQRQVNEDRCFIDKDIGLYIVADGVGGMDKGELASKLACDAIEDCIKSGQTLSESVYSAHKAIINEININQQQQGMATTITAVLFNNNSYEVAWVGDSRLYLWDGNLKLLTRDDSYVELLLENGHISIDDLETHPDRNIISQALGIERKKLAINSNSGTLEKDELLLLCTDGLYSIASEEIIINAINKISDVEKLTEHLVQIAVDKDGKDNISLISIRSDTNVPTTDNKIIPNIVRQFDAVTGKMRGVASATASNSRNQNKKDSQSAESSQATTAVETDPELVDQTTFIDLTAQDRALLDSAAAQVGESDKPNKYKVAIILGVITLVVSIILVRLI